MSNFPELAIIAAVAKNNVIGLKNQLPWRIAGELAYFKRMTEGDAVIMGRKTWESLPKRPLANRFNLIISHQNDYQAAGANVFTNFDAAWQNAVIWSNSNQHQKIWLIGGASIFAEAMKRVNYLYLTEIDQAYDGDVFFPIWPKNEFQLIEVTEGSRINNNPPHRFCVYQRK